MFFNVMTLINNYLESTNGTQEEAFYFLYSNRRTLDRQLFKEMSLNYRTYFSSNNKLKILNDFKKFITTKPCAHNSDLAIGYNIVKFVKINKKDEDEIIQFMYVRLTDVLPKSLPNKLKKHFVLNYIDANILIKKRL
jgi:hypothetical protein